MGQIEFKSSNVLEELPRMVHLLNHPLFDQLGEANGSSADEPLCAAGARIKIEDFAGNDDSWLL
jgi:hypothetical protein